MKMRVAFVGLLLASLLPAAASARDQLGERDPVVIDPQSAYILYRTSARMDVQFMREVDAAERTAWEAAREQAFQRASTRNERAIAQWDREVEQCRGGNAASAYCSARGPRPVRVTRENFAFDPPESDNFVSFSRGRVFERVEGGFTYLRAVDPGFYVLYGPMTVAPNGAAAGVCLCMGSIRFEARPGQVVDIGELRLGGEEGGPAQGRFGPSGRLPSPVVVPPDPAAARSPRLAGVTVVPADLHAADRMPNYFGILIDRLAPVPAVLEYRRDEVIDVKTQGTVAAAVQ